MVAPVPVTLSLDDRILEAVADAVAEAIAAAEARGEARARALRTHLSVDEAAEALSVSPRHVRTLIERGELPSLRLGTRVVVPRIALERLGVPA